MYKVTDMWPRLHILQRHRLDRSNHALGGRFRKGARLVRVSYVGRKRTLSGFINAFYANG